MDTALPVTLVVDTEFGRGVCSLVEKSDVWLVQSPKNSEASKQLCLKVDCLSPEFQGSLSTFEAQGNTKEDWVCAGIDLIDQHHGEHAQPMPYTTLVIIGAKPTPLIVETLSEIGRFEIEESQDGFVAIRASGAV